MTRITKRQKQILNLLKLGYSVSTVAKRLKVGRSAVYKIIGRMQLNGLITKGPRGQGGTIAVCKPIRLHGQQFQIQLLHAAPMYFKIMQKSNIQDFGDFKARLYKKNISLWIRKDFTRKSERLAYSDSLEYLSRTLKFLENRLGVLMLKKGYQNIKEVKAHYSEINNELAQDYNKTKQKLRVRAPEDNKTWLEIDNSYNLNELETKHPDTAQDDIRNIKEQFIFMRDNPQAFQTIIATLEALAESQKVNTKHISNILRLLSHSPDVPNPDYIG